MNANESSLSNNPRLKRIQSAGRIFSIIFFTITVICAVGTAILFGVSVLARAGNLPRTDLMSTGACEASFTFLSWCCYKLFTLYAQGELFTVTVVSSIRRIGYGYVLVVLTSSVCQLVLSHSSTIVSHSITTNSMNTNWPIHFFTLAFSGALPAFLIIFIAWIMDEGRKLREEQELTV